MTRTHSPNVSPSENGIETSAVQFRKLFNCLPVFKTDRHARMPAWFITLLDQKEPNTPRLECNTTTLYLVTENDRQIISPLTWIIRNQENAPSLLDDAIFQQSFSNPE